MSANFIEVGPFQPVISLPALVGREFRKDWYAIYDWPEYSPTLDCAFCFTCCAFGESKTDTFQGTGFGNWKKATEKLNEHQKIRMHISAGLKMKGHQQIRKTGSIATQINTEHTKRMDENREYLNCPLWSWMKPINQNQGNFFELNRW